MTTENEKPTNKNSRSSAQVRCHRRKTQRMAEKGKLATNSFLSRQAKDFLDHGVSEIEKLGLMDNYADGQKVYTEELRGIFIEHLIGFYQEKGGPLAELTKEAPHLTLVKNVQEVSHVG